MTAKQFTKLKVGDWIKHYAFANPHRIDFKGNDGTHFVLDDGNLASDPQYWEKAPPPKGRRKRPARAGDL